MSTGGPSAAGRGGVAWIDPHAERSNGQQRSRAGPSGGLSRAPEGPGGPPNRAERAPDSGQTGGTVSSLENRTGQRTEPAH